VAKEKREVPVEVFSLDELAAMYGCGKRTLQRHAAEGRLKTVRLGRKVVVTRENWEAFLSRGDSE